MSLHGLTAAQSGPLLTKLSGPSMQNLGQVSLTPPIQVVLSASVAGFLGTFARERAAVSGVLDLLVVSLAAIGIVVVLLGALLLAEQRRGEFAPAARPRRRPAGSWPGWPCGPRRWSRCPPPPWPRRRPSP